MNHNEITTALTNTVKGIELRDKLPRTGGGWYFRSGSDTYGGTIGRVAKDGSWFECISDDGYHAEYAKFDHRKNSRSCGCYLNTDSDQYKPEQIAAMTDEQVYKLLKYQRHFRHIISVSNKPQCTSLDPSF